MIENYDGPYDPCALFAGSVCELETAMIRTVDEQSREHLNEADPGLTGRSWFAAGGRRPRRSIKCVRAGVDRRHRGRR